MLAIRLLFILAGVAIVLTLLGYAISRDPRWLRLAGLSLKGALALIVLVMLLYLVERVLLVI